MKNKNIVMGLLVAFVLASCAPAGITFTKTPIPSQTLTPIPTPSITPTFAPTVEWSKIKPTPLNLSLNETDKIPSLLNQIYPDICMGGNLAILTPPPLDTTTPPKLKFTEIDTPLVRPLYIIYLTADNIDHSLRAYVADIPKREKPTVYIQNNKTGKIYEVDIGEPDLFVPFNLVWLNKDTFFVEQTFMSYEVQAVAINFNKQEYVYYSIGVHCCHVGQIYCWGTPRATP